MGLASSTLEPSPCAKTVVNGPCYTIEGKKKKLSKFNTLKKRLSRGKGGFRNHDHGKMLRELMHTWTNEEIEALVKEYETCLNVKELKAHTNLVRSCSAPGLKEDLLKLYKDAFCTDTTLVFQDFYVRVHKAILSSRCSYFKDLLSRHPQRNPVIHMESKAKGITKEIFSTLLCYLYTGDFVLKKPDHEYLDVLINLGEEFGTPNVLEQDLKALLSSGEYADVVLVFPGQCSSDTCNFSSCGCLLPDCNSYEIRCHKAILSARSPYFRSLLNRKDLNSVGAGSKKSKCVRLVLDESILTRHYAHAVLQCMYTDSVDLLSVVKWSAEEKRDCGLGAQKRLTPIEIAMELFEVASFIDLPVLMQAFTKLASFLGCEDIIIGELLSPSTLVPTLKWSCQPHGSAWVYSQAIQFLQEEFVNIAQSESFYLLPRSYLVEALKSDFLQACEHDVLLSVVKWGEGQVARKMSDREPAQDSKKSSKRREIDSMELKKALSGVIDHVRLGHVIPSHSELLESVFRRGLVDRGMPLDIGEGSFCPNLRRGLLDRGMPLDIGEGYFYPHLRRSLVDRGMPLDIGEGNFYPNLPWMRRREEKDFVRPRLFLPYYEEAKAILQERRQIEMEQGRQRMSRASSNMPDTLYMLEPQKLLRRKTEPASNLRRTAAAFGRLDLGTGHAAAQTSMWCVGDSERTERANSQGAGDGGADGSDKMEEREFALPDVAMELPSHVRDQHWTEASTSRRHPFGLEEADPVLSPVPDVALPSSPTPSVSSGVPLEYLRMGQSRERLDDEISNGSS